MKKCPECKRLSRDDDFCSHCGCAVFGRDNYSSGDISCSSYTGHSHEKQSFAAYTPQNYQEIPQRRDFNERSVPAPKKKKKGIFGWIVLIYVVLKFLSEFSDDIF